jgi:hypothetical protein
LWGEEMLMLTSILVVFFFFFCLKGLYIPLPWLCYSASSHNLKGGLSSSVALSPTAPLSKNWHFKLVII